jgi:hypothetical protein
MVSGYVASVKTRASTGDVVLNIEVPKEQLFEAFPLNLEPIVILKETEYAALVDVAEGSED